MTLIDPARIRATPKRHRVDLLSTPNAKGHCFESPAEALAEDERRLVSVARLRDELVGPERILCEDVFQALVGAIAAGTTRSREVRQGSLASSLDFRHARIDEGAKILSLIEGDLGEVRVVVVVPNDEQFLGSDLARWNVERFKARFRSHLNRLGIRDADGFMIAYVHCDYDPSTGMMSPHWHILAKGGVLAIIERLRGCHKFRSVRAGASPESPVKCPVRVHSGPPKNVVSAVTYLMKSYWPAITSGEDGGGRHIRYKQRNRLPEPLHAQVLLWMHQQRLQNLRLLIGVRETTAGLVRRK